MRDMGRDKGREPWGRDFFIAVSALCPVSCQEAKIS
jgi:glycogen debranching enzyme